MTYSIKPVVTIFVPSLCGGGAERVMVTLANAFANRQLAVDIVLATSAGPYYSELSPNVNVVNLGCTRVLASIPAFVKYLRRRRPTALLSALDHANLAALIAKKLAGIDTRVVVSERNDSSRTGNQNRSLRHLAIRFLCRHLYRTADVIHSVSYGVATAVSREFGLPIERIRVVYNPIDMQVIMRSSCLNDDSASFLTDGSRLILSVGRLTAQKDFSTLIRAFAIVRTHLDARLVILGEGDLRSELESLASRLRIQDSVLLPGFFKNPFAVMKQADLFVLSSAWEGLPNVLIQAMACGTPVVSSACPSGPAEILENGRWGRLVPVADVEALAKAMLDTLTETEHPDVAKRAAFFSVERAADEYLRLLLPGLNQ